MPVRDCAWLNVRPATVAAGGAPDAALAVARAHRARLGRSPPTSIAKDGIEVGGGAS